MLERLRQEAAEARAPVEWFPAEGAGGALADLLLEVAPDRAARLEAAFAIEAVLEGFLCHQGAPRLFRSEDDDLALLTGDLLYALGLRAVASAGDTISVSALADLIRLSAGLAAEDRADALLALWPAQAIALADPADGEFPELIEGLGDNSDREGARLTEAAAERAARAGADGAFERAGDALQSAFEAISGTR